MIRSPLNIVLGFLACCWSVASVRGSAPGVTDLPLLYQRQLIVDRSVNIFQTDEFALDVDLGNSYFTPSNPLSLFAGETITPRDVGRVLIAGPTSDGFSNAVQRLTDGANEFVRLIVTEKASGRSERRGWQESGFFMGLADADSPDLRGTGAGVGRVELKIDSFRFQTGSAGSPNAVTAPPVELKMTISFFGVPEPTAVGSLLPALAAWSAGVYTSGGRRRRGRGPTIVQHAGA